VSVQVGECAILLPPEERQIHVIMDEDSQSPDPSSPGFMLPSVVKGTSEFGQNDEAMRARGCLFWNFMELYVPL